MDKAKIFPPPIMDLPKADIPISGLEAHLFQGKDQQIIFMEFSENVELAEHSHADQWGIVLEGRIDLTVGGVGRTYRKGDRYFIPAGTPHSGKIFAGYADVTFFGQKDRYGTK